MISWNIKKQTHFTLILLLLLLSSMLHISIGDFGLVNVCVYRFRKASRQSANRQKRTHFCCWLLLYSKNGNNFENRFMLWRCMPWHIIFVNFQSTLFCFWNEQFRWRWAAVVPLSQMTNGPGDGRLRKKTQNHRDETRNADSAGKILDKWKWHTSSERKPENRDYVIWTECHHSNERIGIEYSELYTFVLARNVHCLDPRSTTRTTRRRYD